MNKSHLRNFGGTLVILTANRFAADTVAPIMCFYLNTAPVSAVKAKLFFGHTLVLHMDPCCGHKNAGGTHPSPPHAHFIL